ncbi:MAG: NADH:flavin oxidoreductase [Haloarculaceae archaeon]
MPALTDPLDLARCTLDNRLYRAPLLECAGNGPDAVETLVRELEPAAAAGAGLLFQGGTIVRGEGGCAAPNMTRVHDPGFVARLERLTDAVHDHGGRIFLQLEHGGLRSLETWHAGYREAHPGLRQLAASRPPGLLRALDRAGFLDYDVHVLSTGAVEDLAADFGRAAERAVAAGYDGIHVAGANMGLVQQFLSPYYNRRDDAYGGSLRERFGFLEAILDAVRDRVGPDVPVVTKVPAEVGAPALVRRHLSLDDGVRLCELAADAGFDAVVPVTGSVFWDMHLVRGEFPDRAWELERYQSGYREAFGGPLRARAVELAHRLQARSCSFEPAWNADFCRRVRERVSVPVFMEGGLRERERMERLLGDACDAVGVGRPFYAEPRLPVRLLAEAGAETACANCNNCLVPQVTGAAGVCRTPSVLEERGRYEKAGAYER